MKSMHIKMKHRWLHRVIAISLGAAIAGLGTGASPVQAATLDGMLSFSGFHVGAFQSSDGTRVYCLEPGAESPKSHQLAAIKVDSLPAHSHFVDDLWGWRGEVSTEEASGETLRRMNWVLTKHGASASAEQAVGVQLALWELRRGPGNSGWIDGKLELIRQNGGQHHIDQGLELAKQARAEAKGPATSGPDGVLSLQASKVKGNGSVSYPAGATELSITGATFADGSTSVKLKGDTGGSLTWMADLHKPGWSSTQTVTVSGKWAMEESYWPAELILHPPSKQNEQRLGAGISPVTAVQTGSFEAAKLTMTSNFVPAISTAVPQKVVSRGDATFSDTVTVSSASSDLPWPSRAGGKEFLPLIADGTLYGPFVRPQAVQEVAPEEAPVFAQTTLAIDRGPGSYDVQIQPDSIESGYYYWVWAINEPAQPENVRKSGLLKADSRYADQFGVREEGQLVPTDLRLVTQLKEQQLEAGERTLEDSVKASLHGGAWLEDESGDRIPARVRFTVYQSDERPVQQEYPPAEAEELGHVFTTIAESDVWVDAPAFSLPEDIGGWVTVRACILEEDQAPEVSGYIADWCDDYGVEEETAELLQETPPEEITPPVESTDEPPAPAEPDQPLANTGSGEDTPAIMAGAGFGCLGILFIIYKLISRRAAEKDSRDSLVVPEM